MTISTAAHFDASVTEVADLVRALESDLESGLTASEAQRRLLRDGPNELRSTPPISRWRRAVAQLHDPLVYLLLVAAGVALAAWIIEGRHGWPIDTLVVLTVVVLNSALGVWQETKAADAVAALARMTKVTSSVVRDGRVQRVASADLVRGDVLVLGVGNAVGADARLATSASLHVLEASLTGESEAVEKNAATLRAVASLGDRRDMVFQGTAVTQGNGRGIVTAVGMDSEMGAIATLLDATADAPTPLQVEIAHIGRVLALAAVVIAVVVIASILLISGSHSGGDIVQALMLGLSLAVAVVPEGLPAILSVVLAMGVQRMARRHGLVKQLASVETLGSASVIASDKTGTLTRGEMTIVRVITVSGECRVEGVGYAPVGRVLHADAPLTDGPLRDELIAVLGGGSLAGNAQLAQSKNGAWEIHGDPTAASFLVAERKLGATDERMRRYERVGEIPFTSQRKRMSTIETDHDRDDQRILVTKGAPDVLIGLCTHMRVGKVTVALDAASRERLLTDVQTLADDALRTLSVACRPLEVGERDSVAPELEHDLVFIGTVGIVDPPRAEAVVAIREAHRAGIRVVMITGDHPRTAARIAADLGLVEPGARVLSGIELDALDDAALVDAARTTSVFARVAPKHKLRIVGALKADGNVVAMTGDGVNDAPALKAADIGIAMGMTGTEVTKEAARMILADDNFATIVDAVREGRGVLDDIRKFLRYLLSSNLSEVLTVFLGLVGAGVLGLKDATVSGVVLPLLATQILWINLITDTGPALAMGVDPIADDVMARKPRPRDKRMIDGRMWLGIVEAGSVMAVTTLLTLDMNLPGGLIEGTGDLATARTAAFTVLVLAQLFNCFNARSGTASAFRALFANRWLWASIVLSVALQVAVVHLPFLNAAFGTAPLSLRQWFWCVTAASGVLWFIELRKWIRRARDQQVLRLAVQGQPGIAITPA